MGGGSSAEGATSMERRLYPQTKQGNQDEWAAVQAIQIETANKIKKEQDTMKRQFMANEFGKK